MVQNTAPLKFQHVFETVGIVPLRDQLLDHWLLASRGHPRRDNGRCTDTFPPKVSGPANGVTIITVPARSWEPLTEKPRRLADPEWVQRISEMGFDPSSDTFSSTDFNKHDSLRPLEFRLRDLGGTRAELVAKCWDADLEPHFRRWIEDLVSLWPEAAPAIDRYLGREAGEGEPALAIMAADEGRGKTEAPSRGSPHYRQSDHDRGVAIWDAIAVTWEKSFSYAKCKAVLRERYPHLLRKNRDGMPVNVDSKTLKRIIRDGREGLLR